MTSRGRALAALVISALAIVNMGLATQASAEENRKGNWELFVDAGACAYEWQDQAWCGPSLVVHADMYLFPDDRYNATMTLQGPSGPVPLQYDGFVRYNGGRGASAVDPTYWGPSFETRTPTGGLAPGTYGATLSVDVSGRWSCSIYNRDGCSWLEGQRLVIPWVFEWNGQDTISQAIPTIQAAEGAKFGNSLISVDAIVAPLRAGIPITLQKKTGGKWKTVKTKKSGFAGRVNILDKSRGGTYRVFAGGREEFALTIRVT